VLVVLLGLARKVRATEIETFERSTVVAPNSDLVSSAVTNWNHKNRDCRLIVEVRVPFGNDARAVHDLLLDSAREHPDILRWPPAHVLFTDFGEIGLVFELRCYAQDVNYYLSAPSELRFAIDQRLREAGITIPYPARDIHVRTCPGRWTSGAKPTAGRRTRANARGRVAGCAPCRTVTAPNPERC
jgi:small-conductance mechanosensitive channel